GPGGTATVGSNGGVGDHAWRRTHTGIEPGWLFDNSNFTFPNTSFPYNSGLAPGPADIISVSSNSTSSVAYLNVATPPGPLPPGQTRGTVTTNSSVSTTTVYPGAVAGLTTNTSWTTTSTYPGAQPQLTTNYTGFTTVNNYPGNRPLLTTNCGTTVIKTKT